MESMNRMEGLDDMLYPGNENIVGKEANTQNNDKDGNKKDL